METGGTTTNETSKLPRKPSAHEQFLKMKSTHLTATSANELLAGLTVVGSITFTSLAPDNQCELTLTMRRDEVSEGGLLTLRFHGVAVLNISDFGGGLTQVMHLHVEDVGARQWERINYSISDLENNRLAFLCRSIECIDSAR